MDHKLSPLLLSLQIVACDSYAEHKLSAPPLPMTDANQESKVCVPTKVTNPGLGIGFRLPKPPTPPPVCQ